MSKRVNSIKVTVDIFRGDLQNQTGVYSLANSNLRTGNTGQGQTTEGIFYEERVNVGGRALGF